MSAFNAGDFCESLQDKKIQKNGTLTHNSPIFRVKFSVRNIRIFPLKYEILSFEKCLSY